MHIMEDRKRQRCTYVSARQKKKLIELMAKHPQLISCKITRDFTYKDSQILWQNIASECNAIPGARKTWRQWRKTWHDIRSKTKKKQAETNGEVAFSTATLSTAEQEALGIKTSNSDEYHEGSTEFVPLCENQDFSDRMSVNSLSEPNSPPEQKVFVTESRTKKLKIKNKHGLKHPDNCYFNCDLIAVHEQRKVQIKEDYLNFKKDYLRQKLKILKEQTEALKSIAKELSK